MSLPQALTLQNPQEADQGSLKGKLLREGETSGQLHLKQWEELVKAPSLPLLLWVIPGCMDNEKKLSKGRFS